MLTALTAGLIGIASWSFAEYAIHHWVGHLGKGKNPFSREHLRHHRDGQFTPWGRKYLQAFAVALALFVGVGWTVGLSLGIGWSLGFVCAYLMYEWTHRRLHTHPPRNEYGRMLRRHHFSHHFSSAKFNHGVTSVVWDHVFSTYRQPERIRVPKRLAMPWLLDEQGRLLPAYASDYELR